MRHADDFQAAFVVNEDQELHVPGKHPCKRVRPERALAGKTERQVGEFHADARLLARRLELRAGARDVTRERAEQVRIVPRHSLHPAAERQLQHGRDHALLAVLGEQGDASSTVHVRHITRGRDCVPMRFQHDKFLMGTSKNSTKRGRSGMALT